MILKIASILIILIILLLRRKVFRIMHAIAGRLSIIQKLVFSVVIAILTVIAMIYYVAFLVS
jgi:hypothetical protein